MTRLEGIKSIDRSTKEGKAKWEAAHQAYTDDLIKARQKIEDDAENAIERIEEEEWQLDDHTTEIIDKDIEEIEAAG